MDLFARVIRISKLMSPFKIHKLPWVIWGSIRVIRDDASRFRLRTVTAVSLIAMTLWAYGIPGSPLLSDQPPSLISSEEFSYRVVLGEKISVRLSARSDREIAEVKAIYSPRGKKTVSSYAYPSFKRNGQLIEVWFDIDVKSPRYFPPGTVFDIHFEFIDDDGQSYLSEVYTFENIDRERGWRRYSDGILELVYYGIEPDAMARLHSDVSSHLPRIGTALGISIDSAMRAVIFPNLRDLTRYGPRVSEAATDGIFFGGYAYSQYNLTIMASPSAPILTHELTHLLFNRAFTSPYAATAPAWLNEGIASYFESDRIDSSNADFRRFLRSRKAMRFNKMKNLPGRRADIAMFYAQSVDFVGFLASNYEENRLGELLSALNEGENINAALQSVYGKSLNELENSWRASHGLSRLPAPLATMRPAKHHVLPTIPGLPTLSPDLIVVGKSREDANRSRTSAPTPQTLQLASATAVKSAPTVTSSPGGEYNTIRPGQELPRPNLTMIFVFALLAIGLGALIWRRMRG